MIKVTILTATYNRGECLKDCWKSIKEQTCKDFQWLIVDDGSTDNTREVVNNFKQESPEICIDYVYKENGGKHTALNASHKHIKGKYVFTLDSDDSLNPDAIELLIRTWDRFENQKDVGQVIFLKGYSENEPICYVQHENIPVDTLKEERIGKIGRDCCDSFRTELFIKYPFPEFEKEKFIGEGSSFFFIELESKGVYVNKVIYLCEYRDDGLTKAGRKMRIMNPMGGRYNSRVYMNKRLPAKTRFKKGILYTAYSKFANISLLRNLKENEYKLLTLVTYIPGVLLYKYWKNKYCK